MRPALLVLLLSLSACSKPLTGTTIHDRLETLFQLHTVEMVFRDVVYHRSNQRLAGLIPFDHRETLFRVFVSVRAGFDLSRPEFAVAVDNGQVRIRLPEPEILWVDADDSSLHEYFSRDGNIGLRFLQEHKAKRIEDNRARALQMGILAEAKRNARLLVIDLMRELGVDRWSLEFSAAPAGQP